MKSDYSEFLNLIETSLRPWNYEFVTHTSETINDVDFIGCIMTSRRWMTRYICAVISLPKNLKSHQEFLIYADKGLKALSNHYAQFPYFKELGTYLVVLGDAKQYENLSVAEGEFKHKSGLHTNVWLGTVLIDEENHLTTGQNTWGLYYSGKHYKAIKTSVETWCKMNQQQVAVG